MQLILFVDQAFPIQLPMFSKMLHFFALFLIYVLNFLYFSSRSSNLFVVNLLLSNQDVSNLRYLSHSCETWLIKLEDISITSTIRMNEYLHPEEKPNHYDRANRPHFEGYVLEKNVINLHLCQEQCLFLTYFNRLASCMMFYLIEFTPCLWKLLFLKGYHNGHLMV